MRMRAAWRLLPAWAAAGTNSAAVCVAEAGIKSAAAKTYRLLVSIRVVTVSQAMIVNALRANNHACLAELQPPELSVHMQLAALTPENHTYAQTMHAPLGQRRRCHTFTSAGRCHGTQVKVDMMNEIAAQEAEEAGVRDGRGESVRRREQVRLHVAAQRACAVAAVQAAQKGIFIVQLKWWHCDCVAFAGCRA